VENRTLSKKKYHCAYIYVCVLTINPGENEPKFACPLFQVSYVFINGNTYSQADSDQTSIKRHVPVT